VAAACDIVRDDAGLIAGAHIITQPASAVASPGTDVLFLITPDGLLDPATTSGSPTPKPSDTLVLLAP
jgi:hypothetical protein